MMKLRGARPNYITIYSVIPVCGHWITLKSGKVISYYLTRHGIPSNLFVKNALLDMYGKCESI